MAIVQCPICWPTGKITFRDGSEFTCFVCDGTGSYDDAPPPPSPAYDAVMGAIETWRQEWAEYDVTQAVMRSLT